MWGRSRIYLAVGKTLEEIRVGARRGVSPGFIINKVEADDEFNLIVESSEIYELSVVGAPRNRGARVLGMEASMGMSMDSIGNASPELVSLDDPVGLALVAGRKALDSGRLSDSKRAKLQEFYRLYDAGLENGLTRDKAAQAAKLVAGI